MIDSFGEDENAHLNILAWIQFYLIKEYLGSLLGTGSEATAMMEVFSWPSGDHVVGSGLMTQGDKYT